MTAVAFPKLAQLRTVDALRNRLLELGCPLPIDSVSLSAAEGSPLGEPVWFGPQRVGNRWCVQPMEGWDAQDGVPGPLTFRRWERFGLSGAKLVWGGEAAAVALDARAHRHQLVVSPKTAPELARLRAVLVSAHRAHHGTTDDLVIGLQLTHSGRYARSDECVKPRLAFRHPLLDAHAEGGPLWTDSELTRVIEQFVAAAGIAVTAGFDFVDIKTCHGYLLHELLAAHERPGSYGGDLPNRTRLLREVIQRIRWEFPGLLVAVRLSAFDTAAVDSTQCDLRETVELLKQLAAWGVVAVNVSGGCPYTRPHLLRPAAFPPCDGYPPPEDPLVGVARHVMVTRDCKQTVPELAIVGSGYSYLQHFVPHVAQATVRSGWTDFVGLGRMMLAYPEFPADVLAGRPLERKRICRTLSDCTTAPRNGLVSGCFPLDPYYAALPEAERLRAAKVRIKSRLAEPTPHSGDH